MNPGRVRVVAYSIGDLDEASREREFLLLDQDERMLLLLNLAIKRGEAIEKMQTCMVRLVGRLDEMSTGSPVATNFRTAGIIVGAFAGGLASRFL